MNLRKIWAMAKKEARQASRDPLSLAMLLGLRCPKGISAMDRGHRLPTLELALTMEVVLGTRFSDIYPDWCAEIARAAVRREEHLPLRFKRHIRGRVLRKD